MTTNEPKVTQVAKSITLAMTSEEVNTDVVFHALALAAINLSLGIGITVDRFCDATSDTYQDMVARNGTAPTVTNTEPVKLSIEDEAKVTPVTKKILDAITKARVNEEQAFEALAISCIGFVVAIERSVEDFCRETRELYEVTLKRAGQGKPRGRS